MEKRSFTIFTAEGISFEGTSTTLARALSRAAVPAEYTVVAVVETASLVKPSGGALTALVVQSVASRQRI